MTHKEKYFYNFITHLRSNEEVILYKNILEIPQEEIEEVISYLENEYKKETLNYPLSILAFNTSAAIWATRIFYYSSQLLLFREQQMNVVYELIQAYENEITPDAILSADIVLRFIPPLLIELKLIDSGDPLIIILENILHTWHYSAIGYIFSEEKELDFSIIKQDDTLHQLYIDRVLDHNVVPLIKHPELKESILSTLGIYKDDLLKNFDWD